LIFYAENSANQNPSVSGSESVSGSKPLKADSDPDTDSDPESLDYRFLQFSCAMGAPQAREQLFRKYGSKVDAASRRVPYLF
jgi:hypothetical protein